MKGKGAGPKLPFSGPGNCAVLNCPLDAPFLNTLAAAVLDGDIWNEGVPQPHDLPGLSIYLPTHASVDPLQLAFLARAPNGATFLPRIRVLGEVDPLDLFAAFGMRMASVEAALGLLERALAVPSAFGRIERQIQLCALVLAASRRLRSTRLFEGERIYAEVQAVSAYRIAGEIASLIDEAHADGADFSRIDRLDTSHASGSEQLSLQLLRAVHKGWQADKAKSGKLDQEERRNRLMDVEAEFIRQSGTPVIIAGSTGSVAATMTLMEALSGRPKSAIVLHGLDTELDPKTWAGLEAHPEHPQHGLHRLLERLNVTREDVPSLSAESMIGHWKAGTSAAVAARSSDPEDPAPDSEALRPRLSFLSEAMRPASATGKWAEFVDFLKRQGERPAPGLSLIETETMQDEAAAIALVLRDSLESECRSAALVTPDENLARRVRHALAQYGLADKGPLPPSADIFAARVASCAASQKPEALAALLRHADPQTRKHAEIIDLGVLRQMWRPSALEGLPAALSRAQHAIAAGEARHPAMKRITEEDWQATRALTTHVIDALSPLTVDHGRSLALADWLERHSEVLARLKKIGLMVGGDGNNKAVSLEEMQKSRPVALLLDLVSYAELFAEVVAAAPRRDLGNSHPRLFFWTPLDARLLTADVIVLGGLNEGCWPHTPGPSPWLDRRGRSFIGLSAQERRTGQAAHDFAALAASAQEVILTRSRKVNGSLARPSRWVSRIKTLSAGAGRLKDLEPPSPWPYWVRALRVPQAVSPAARPAPRPPVAARPRRLSVTAIETWFANPYAIYARHILGLDPLREFLNSNDLRDKGVLYHMALHRFFEAYPHSLPSNAAERLLRELDKAARDLGFNLENAPFWRPRFARFAAWFAKASEIHRRDVRMIKSEAGGKLRLEAPGGPFDITARADRIDLIEDGSLRIYDFKTSANTAKASAKRGAPQLALEGLLAREGAFAGIAVGSKAELAYIVASGGEPSGEIVHLNVPSAEAIEAAYTGTRQRIARFDDPETPYVYEVRAIYRDKSEYDPYAHLARVQEWALVEQGSEGGDD